MKWWFVVVVYLFCLLFWSKPNTAYICHLQAAHTALWLSTFLTLSNYFSVICTWEIKGDRIFFTAFYSVFSYCNGVIISATHLDQDIWWGRLQILLRFIQQEALYVCVLVQKPTEVNRRTLEQAYNSFSVVASCCLFFFFVAAGSHLNTMTKGKKRETKEEKIIDKRRNGIKRRK